MLLGIKDYYAKVRDAGFLVRIRINPVKDYVEPVLLSLPL